METILDGSCYEHMAIGKNTGDGFKTCHRRRFFVYNWISCSIQSEGFPAFAGFLRDTAAWWFGLPVDRFHFQSISKNRGPNPCIGGRNLISNSQMSDWRVIGRGRSTKPGLLVSSGTRERIAVRPYLNHFGNAERPQSDNINRILTVRRKC